MMGMRKGFAVRKAVRFRKVRKVEAQYTGGRTGHFRGQVATTLDNTLDP